MTVTRREEIVQHWQEKLNITFGMTKEEALEKFRAWQENKKTCQNCEGEGLIPFCDIHLICKEAEEEKDERSNVEGDGDRGRVDEVDGNERVRISLSEERERVALR